jgi:hypothetical protein
VRDDTKIAYELWVHSDLQPAGLFARLSCGAKRRRRIIQCATNPATP